MKDWLAGVTHLPQPKLLGRTLESVMDLFQDRNLILLPANSDRTRHAYNINIVEERSPAIT